MNFKHRANPIVVLHSVLPGYMLLVSTVATTEWPFDWFGLVAELQGTSNVIEPLTVFPAIVAKPVTAENPAATTAYANAVAALGAGMRLSPSQAVQLVTACQAAGFDAQRDGELAVWLMNRLAALLQSGEQALSHLDAVCDELRGNGIYSIGANAAMSAMAVHWKSHLAERHSAAIILSDIEGLRDWLTELSKVLRERLNLK